MPVELLDARINEFERRDDIVGRVEHIEQGDARPLKGFGQDERELHLQARQDEAVGPDLRSVRNQHVVQQRPVVRLRDLGRDLHGAGGQADLVTNDFAPILLAQVHPGALDGIAVFDIHGGMKTRKVFKLGACALRFVQLARQRGMQCGAEIHGMGLVGADGRPGVSGCELRLTIDK
ncbi:hypothetical protein D3C71_1078560 [compost metagenome]